jgi:Spy/CpxP family protein refolding chaperone
VKLTVKSAVITIVLGFIAGIAGMGIGHLLFTGPSAPDTSLHGMVHEELTLSAEQDAQIDALETSFAARRTALEEELRQANGALAAAILKSNDAAGPEVEVAVHHVHDAMGALQTETIDHVFAMRRILTPEQRAKFDDRIKRALTAGGP